MRGELLWVMLASACATSKPPGGVGGLDIPDAASGGGTAPDDVGGQGGGVTGEVGQGRDFPARRDCGQRKSGRVTLFERERNGGSLRLFTSPDGFDLFWLERRGEPPNHSFVRVWQALKRDGRAAARSQDMPFNKWRHIAATPDRSRYAFVEQESSGPSRLGLCDKQNGGLACRLGDALPLEGSSHSDVAVAYDPISRQWGVLYEEVIGTGYVYDRLYFSLFDADGHWLPGSRVALANDANINQSAEISDWGEPLIWTGRSFAFLWVFGGRTTELRLSEVSANGVNTVVIENAGPAIRATLAYGGQRYGAAWGSMDQKSKYHMRFATVTAHRVGNIVRLGDQVEYSSDSSITATASGFLVVWHEQNPTGSAVYYARLNERSQNMRGERITDAGFKDHDWAQDADFDGCQAVVTVMHYINPSGAYLQFLPAEQPRPSEPRVEASVVERSDHCPTYGDVVVYEQVDRGTGAAQIFNQTLGARYRCELLWDQNGDNFDCTRDPNPELATKIVSLGLYGVPCEQGKFGNIGTGQDRLQGQHTCSYVCTAR